MSSSYLIVGAKKRSECVFKEGEYESKMEHTLMETNGFIAALDQSGGSTPAALERYGYERHLCEDPEQMFNLVHDYRTRIIKSRAFAKEYVCGAILFENTLDRNIDGMSTTDFLWKVKGIVPFLKCDQGLLPEKDGVRLMNPMTRLDEVLDKGVTHGVFGTKMRSLINANNTEGIKNIVDQQFEYAEKIIMRGLCPIIEPEVNIHAKDKHEIESTLLTCILQKLDLLKGDKKVMLKLTLPESTDLYRQLIDHPRVLMVVALSGGYSMEEANERLSEQRGMSASFSRALVEGLRKDMSEAEFENQIGSTITKIHAATNLPIDA